MHKQIEDEKGKSGRNDEDLENTTRGRHMNDLEHGRYFGFN